MNRGFTLIEVMVAVALVAIISLLTWQALGTLTASKERFEDEDVLFGEATLALTRMTRELESAFLYSSPNLLGRTPSGEQRTKNVFIGTDEGGQDRLVFVSLSHNRYLQDAKESDQAEVSYFLEPDEEGGLFVLKKREASPPDAEPEEGGETRTVLNHVKELNFRYYDGQKGEYGDGWDSTKVDNLNKLPRAVEVLLVMKDPAAEEEEDRRFLTTVFLEMAPGPNDF